MPKRQKGTKMLVQSIMHLFEGDELQGNAEVFCSNCSESIGVVTMEELNYLVHKSPADVLCFECEDIKPAPVVPIRVITQNNLMRIFDVVDISEIPTSGWPVWANEDLSVIMQMLPGKGWFCWWHNPDGEFTLKRVKMGASEARRYRELFCLTPYDTHKPLVL